MNDEVSSNKIDPIATYFKEVEKYDVLSPEIMNFLMVQAKKGDKAAKELIITHNLRLVVYFAKREYQKLNKQIPFEDVIQEGNIGLIKAIDHFDNSKGVLFSTYAKFWITQHINRAFEQTGRTIRLPSHIHEAIRYIAKAENDLYQAKSGQKPTIEELSDYTGIPIEKIKTYVEYKRTPVSIDSKIKTQKSKSQTEIKHTIEDDSCDSAEKNLAYQHKKEFLEKMMTTLTEKEENIIRLRYGLDMEGRTKSLEDIAKLFNVSKERIRQIQKRDEEKLKVKINAIAKGNIGQII